LGKEKKSLDAAVTRLASIGSGLRDARELFEMARAENDDATLAGIAADIGAIEKDVGDLEFRRMFSNPLDPNNCFMDIQSGSGGTEAQDWAQMLLRMYLRWGAAHGFSCEVIDSSPGEVAGIKSATIEIQGEYAYGWLRTETGVHRLVRKSPFDSGNRRHTSFASVFVSPEIDDDIEIEVNPADLKVDVYRSSGAGGQHVNKTESAVRITHLPSGIVVACQNERSQHKNRSTAMKMLRAKLYEMELEKQQSARDAARRSQVGTGDRSEKIRTYNFPQDRLTDHRIGLTRHNLAAVMDGDVEDVLSACRTFFQAEMLKGEMGGDRSASKGATA
jgi:peptide chain release factor 2